MMRFKIKHIIFLIFIFFISQISYSQDAVVIRGKVLHPKTNSINISIPVNNLSSWAITKKIKLDRDGNFNFNYETSNIGFYNLWHEIAPYNNITAKLLLNPGDSCYLEFNGETQNVIIQNNNNQSGLQLYNNLCNQEQELEINAENKFRKYSPSEICDTIIKCKNAQLKEVYELFDKGEISQTFYELISKNISYLYGALFYDLVGHVVFMSEQLPNNHPQYFKQSNESLQFADSSLNQLFLSFKQKPIDDIEKGNISTKSINSSLTPFIFSPEYLNILEKFIHYKGYYLPQRNNSFDITSVNKNFHKFNLDLYAQNLKDEEFEYGVSSYFYSWFQKQNIAEGLINPYNSFKKYYPKNPFIPYIDSLAKEYEAFKNLTSTDFSENINFIPGTDSINDFNRLLKQFEGKTLYIDIWATTCPPCLKEFEYYNDLYQFLSLNDIGILFISLDKPSETEHWKKTIKKYNLIGYHILANKNLEADIKKVTKMIGIPWYCIKDKNGNLSKEFINRPSSKEKLHVQINNYINE